jgi:uncharacterized protein
MDDKQPRFWENKPLGEMSEIEWELLCDHCGRCCLHKIEDEECKKVFFTCVACKLYDLENGGCKDYLHRSEIVPACMVLDASNVAELESLPKTCAYRLLHEGKPLPVWHPLISGSKTSVRDARMTIRSFAIAEEDIDLKYVEGFILDSDL